MIEIIQLTGGKLNRVLLHSLADMSLTQTHKGALPYGTSLTYLSIQINNMFCLNCFYYVRRVENRTTSRGLEGELDGFKNIVNHGKYSPRQKNTCGSFPSQEPWKILLPPVHWQVKTKTSC